MTLSEIIGDTLREKIIEKGFNYSTFAEKAGFRQSYISKIVNGKSANLPITTLEKLIKPLGLSMVDFMEAVEKKKPILALT